MYRTQHNKHHILSNNAGGGGERCIATGIKLVGSALARNIVYGAGVGDGFEG